MDAASETSYVWLRNPFPLTDTKHWVRRLGRKCGRPEYVPARVVSRSGAEVTLETVDEPKMTLARREADVLPSNAPRGASAKERTRAELARLAQINAPSLLANVHSRFVAGDCWTYAGRRDGPLLFVNPNGTGPVARHVTGVSCACVLSCFNTFRKFLRKADCTWFFK